MTDEFDTLRRIPSPPPASGAARARALAAAMQAFDAEEKNAVRAKGSFLWSRPSSILNRIWSTQMIAQHRYLAGSALATMLIIPAAAFLTLELTRGNLPSSGQVALPQLADAPRSQVEPAPPKPQGRLAEAKKEQDVAVLPAQKPSEYNADDVARLLNRQEAVGGAAKRAAEPMASRAPAPMPVSPMMAERSPVPAAAPRYAPAKPELLPPLEQSRDRFANADTNPIKSVVTDPFRPSRWMSIRLPMPLRAAR